MGHNFGSRYGAAASLYVPHFAVVSHFETALALRTREKGWDESDPPQNRGGMWPWIAALRGVPLSGPMGGRSRPH